VDGLTVIAALGTIGVAVGLGTLIWIRQRPDLRAWVPVAMVVTVGSAAVLGFGLLPPIVLWLSLGTP
jgi:hypothetical protein